MRVIFVTGTDTGVGKTALTALCAAHLLQRDVNVRVLKPFCSGERTDANILWELQERALPIERVNPFYFAQPVSPWTAARLAGQTITLDMALREIAATAATCDVLLIEGAGGLLAPLGKQFSALDLIRELSAYPIVVAANRLGVLNHTRLTVEALQRRNLHTPRIALNHSQEQDESTKTNARDLELLLPGFPIYQIPFVPAYRPTAEFFRAVLPSVSEVIKALLQF